MGSHNHHTAFRAKVTALSELEITRHLGSDAREFRARAARYRHLAEALTDPQVTAEVHACARELETKAGAIEKLLAFELQTMSDAKAQAMQLMNAAPFRHGAPTPREGTTPARWIINSWCDVLDA